jgi:hypothetical protein
MAGVLALVIYTLCAATAALCTALLLRGYRRTGTSLLFWSGLCFAFLTLNSFAVILDIVVLPRIDLQLVRHGALLAAVGTLLFGLVWDSE